MLVKNNNLIINICEVQIRSSWGVLFPDLAAIYSSLSKISWSSDSDSTDQGLIYKNKLRLSYPGLNQNQFEDLDKLLKGLFELQVKTDSGEIYELAGSQNPMSVDLAFNNGKSEISFSHRAIEPIKYIGMAGAEQEPLGFPYTLTFTLS